MRKVHYRVVLDVLTTENDDIDGIKALEEAMFWLEFNNEDSADSIDVQDIIIESVELTDSR